MPFFIQQPPSADIPRTRIEVKHSNEAENRNQVNNFEFDRNLAEQVYLKDKFYSLKNEWKKQTMFTSSISNIIEDPNFKRIVDMGNKVIPLIIDDIDRAPSNLVWALNIITGAILRTNQRLTITEACKAWVKLYRSGKISL